jgi:hypothetical protein
MEGISFYGFCFPALNQQVRLWCQPILAPDGHRFAAGKNSYEDPKAFKLFWDATMPDLVVIGTT